MDNKSNTKDKDKLEKIKALIDDPKVIMLSTRLDKIPFSVCPMTIQEIDELGDLWFFSSKASSHFNDIEFDNRVQIMYVDNQKQSYISIYGNATHIVDKQKVNELWNPDLTNWFEGKDDPNLILLNVNIDNAYYWNAEESKLVSFF
ncbi:general stress protein 26 [Mariniflexile fucanivorans]|uniref:General stress protein 26 n=1 Tax=Mariniflexile fucanivorans TaxID=264023 RepID=A0A4R1RBS0_9FLAO|nr:pyridoxamine 5'-phosphate oxidase family protein [Mariniflexile fucanivorans]TCL63149.1 general stress protein 26 [Mariniflexile fucanivorans]